MLKSFSTRYIIDYNGSFGVSVVTGSHRMIALLPGCVVETKFNRTLLLLWLHIWEWCKFDLFRLQFQAYCCGDLAWEMTFDILMQDVCFAHELVSYYDNLKADERPSR